MRLGRVGLLLDSLLQLRNRLLSLTTLQCELGALNLLGGSIVWIGQQRYLWIKTSDCPIRHQENKRHHDPREPRPCATNFGRHQNVFRKCRTHRESCHKPADMGRIVDAWTESEQKVVANKGQQTAHRGLDRGLWNRQMAHVEDCDGCSR